jgi:uncharacterized protein YndB with AHSA1/START domain
MNGELVLERRLDLPRAVVWDALVDPVLAEGWLHPSARLAGEEVEGGFDPIEFVEPESPEAVAVLHVDSAELGEVRFELIEVAGGTRGASTDLTLTVRSHGDARFLAPIVAGWRSRLDQLDDLLRGHPVEWQHWQRDRGADYEQYLAEARAAI